MYKAIREYLYLTEPNLQEPKKTLWDQYIDPLVLLREVDNRVSIYFLWTQTSVHIPRSYLTLVRGFDVYYGDLIEEFQERDEFFYHLWKFWKHIISRESPLEELDRILKVGTKVFRETLSEIPLEPWAWVSGKNIYKI